MPRRRRVPVTTRAARIAQDRLAMMRIDPAFEPDALAAIERMHTLAARRRLPRRVGCWRCRKP